MPPPRVIHWVVREKKNQLSIISVNKNISMLFVSARVELSSSKCANSTDSLDFLLPSIHKGYRSWQVLLMESSVCIELMNVGFSKVSLCWRTLLIGLSLLIQLFLVCFTLWFMRWEVSDYPLALLESSTSRICWKRYIISLCSSHLVFSSGIL